MRVFKAINKNIIATSIIQTPLGDMFAAASSKGICMLTFYEQSKIDVQIKRLKETFDAEVMRAHNVFFEQLQVQLDEYFQSKREHFEVPLQLVGSTYEQKVWKILMAIPYGQTISYKQLSELINQTNASTAVSKATQRNMIQILVPSHRVINSSGKIGTYQAGVEKKDFLLKHEEKCACQFHTV
jgi:O-6-methylguanine DNA methyltransferase